MVCVTLCFVVVVRQSSGPRDPYIDRAGSQGIIRCAMVDFAVRQTLTSETIDTIKKTGMERNAAGWVMVDEQTSTPVSSVIDNILHSRVCAQCISCLSSHVIFQIYMLEVT